MSSPIMQLDNVSVRYKTRRSFFRHSYFTALDRISFNIEKGESLGVIGTNGCGKSTLLRVLAGVYGVDEGLVSWHCQQVSLLSLTLGFDFELSGRDNAIISGMFLGSRKQDVIAMLDEIVEFAELEAHIDKPMKTYSSGMRARLGFSVALKMQSELLLIDEVLGVGDGIFKRKATKAMADKICSDQTVVLVSHSLGQVKRLCNRALWMEKGKVRALGKADEVVDEYEQFINKS